jgi:hypothetical protein
VVALAGKLKDTCAALWACRLPQRRPPMLDPETPQHPLRRALRWIVAVLVAWRLLWILLRGAPVGGGPKQPVRSFSL